MVNTPVYMDYNATTPCDPRVVETMLPLFTNAFGNASSTTHTLGWAAASAIDDARQQVARLIGSEVKEIVFTSGATEAANLAIKGVIEMYAGKGNHVITSAIEHNAVLDTLRFAEKKGIEVTYLPVDSKGQPDLSQLEAAIKPETILIAIMYANNELGTILPVKEIGAIAKKHQVLFFCDATQAVGKIPVNVQHDDIDLMAFSAHKLYGPKGVGALYIRRKNPRVRLVPQLHGGGHENGWRSGTLNVTGIAGFGKACSICEHEMSTDGERLKQWRDKLEAGLLQVEQSGVNGDKENRLPHVLNIWFKHAQAENLMSALRQELAVSAGSACTSAVIEPSHVLKAIGLEDELAYSSLRFSLGRFTTDEEIDFVIKAVTEAVRKVREASPAWEMHKQGIEI